MNSTETAQIGLKFNSFLVIDDDNKEHIVKIKFHNQKRPSCKHPKRIIEYYGNLKDNTPLTKNTVTLYKTSNNKFIEAQERIRKNFYADLTQSEFRRKHKAEVYRDRYIYNKRKSNNTETLSQISSTISKSTIRNLKAVLAKHGHYSFKVHHKFDSYTTYATLTIYDENVLQHLYFYNTFTKQRYRLDNYISLASMTGTIKQLYLDSEQVIFTSDVLVDSQRSAYEYAILRYNLYNINIVPSSDENKENKVVIRFDRYM